MKILVLGANGMIGSSMLRVLSQHDAWKVTGSVRSEAAKAKLLTSMKTDILAGFDLTQNDQLIKLFGASKPNVVLNCAGLTKHLPDGNDPIAALTVNAVLPHRLANLCEAIGARFIHVSTDCVFSGKQGMYREVDPSDAVDVYGKTKHLGELTGPKVLNLRTSTIGHEVGTKFGLLEWFLAQRECKGYTRAIFSGLPTVELARVVRDYIIPNDTLSGIYHVGASPIDKDSLLRLIANEYKTNTSIIPDETVVIDRSLDVSLFGASTGYRAADWQTLVAEMRSQTL